MGGSGGMMTATPFAPRVFDFEMDANGWGLVLESREVAAAEGLTEPVHSKDKALTGEGSLRVDLETGAMGGKVFVGIQGNAGETGIVRPITKVTFNLWVPTENAISLVQGYILGFFPEGTGRPWESVTSATTPILPGAWSTFELSFAVPYPVADFGSSVGLEISTNRAWTGSVYIDNVKIEFQGL